MVREETRRLRRQYVVAAALFGALLAACFAVFGYLLVRQLSRSYLEDVLGSGKAQAAELAKHFGGGPLYKVVEQRREVLQRITAALAHQEIVESLQVFDDRGKLVWQTTTKSEGYTGGFPEGNAELMLPGLPKEVVEEPPQEYQIRVPLEDLGSVVLTLSKPVLADRVALLRRRLLLSTAFAGGIGLAVLSAAVAFIWHLMQRNARLEEHRRIAEELATLGSLAANLAHEIRNPLNAISLNLEILEEDIAGKRVEADATRLARQEVGRLSRLVNDFLVYARPQPPSLEECDAAELVRDVAQLLRPVCDREGVELAVDCTGAKVRLDRGQMTQVLVNLALNAVQAMEVSPRRELCLRCATPGTSTVLDVLDTGPGIPEEELERVREAFVTRRRGGTGLGLAIADRVVRAHGATLELSNRAEGGLRARVVLSPRLPEAV